MYLKGKNYIYSKKQSWFEAELKLKKMLEE